MRTILSIASSILFIFSALSLSAQEKTLVYDNATYEDYIRTVQLYPVFGYPQDEVQPAAISLNSNAPLVLEFDDIAEDYEYYYAKLIHCNADWTKSDFYDIDYLSVYNEFAITEYEYSFQTRVPYVHYTFQVPRVKISGNYLLLVYRDQDLKDIILSRRFMVYETAASISMEVGLSDAVIQRWNTQQVAFQLNYNQLEVINPLEQFKVVLRKNQNWNTAIRDLQPTMVRETLREIEYRHFNAENNFSAGNEYRFFDLRTVNFNGQGVESTEIGKDYVLAYLRPDKPRTGLGYVQYNELNGDFLINNLDRGAGVGDTESEYVFVHFALEANNPYPGEVYVQGDFNSNRLEPLNKMIYDEGKKVYRAEIELKQGVYNYQYYLKSETLPPLHIEGNHNQTENAFEIFAYFRDLGARGDRLIGYQYLQHNNRR